ncbi:MAG: copper ABC transporter ATP-binding protein [Ignavibacteria bacterium CG2_30_36_16]|nr:ABC transporter ATP-binding protein [Ignavibacteria bacterium]OIP62756.1 MAG: copper ABC transporter ATP-binding protein [Ignavibacteria bacterium CG2_30_36_16]PJB01390.1 MAG: copper ABC transporter ATP-binding protein [Ignavibacteria bacterium CG_4_9_14_3_um_filter_36_18]
MISIKNLDKKYGSLHALKNINLHVNPGRVTAIVGPNASGKTTLIKSILGLVKPNAGSIEVMGKVINGDCSYKKFIGYMPQSAKFPENLKVREVVNLIKDIRGTEPPLANEISEKFNLTNEMNKLFRTLSGGTKQKVSALIAFMYSPKILILDEPTAGLDPVSAGTLKNLVREEKERGRTIILTSHIMSEIEELSDEIVFLLEGKIHFEGDIESLLSNNNNEKLERIIAKMMMVEAV